RGLVDSRELAVVSARMREQMPHAHVRLPDPRCPLELEEVERERGRERLRDRRDVEPGARIAADGCCLNPAADRDSEGHRRHVPGEHRGLGSLQKSRIRDDSLPYCAISTAPYA